MRRALDIAISLLGLVLLAPALAVCAVLLKRDSPGPIFYRALRVGRGGRPFRLWKLRTMVVGADKRSALTEKDDPRVTAFGRFLRDWKIDELPQLINVLAGDMTLVGPRPETPRIVAQYTPDQWEVLSVRPGITGPSQIHWCHEENYLPPGMDTQAYYLAEILPRKLAVDREYVRNRSLVKDLGYLWQTMIAIIRPSLDGWEREPTEGKSQ
jgi:lipopolysaccharide/colanic/teichoic acid biosynthesis glycosyltransferase